jgi:hypothetical protein
MNRIPMSPAASALLRALVVRSGVERDRILLTDARSTDWQSLTLMGERHSMGLRITGPDAAAVAVRICDGLEDADFALRNQIVADIGMAGEPVHAPDGSISIVIEALTVAE